MSTPPSAATEARLYLVSIGIGDPDNITVKALKVLERVDVVFGAPRLLDAFADRLGAKTCHVAGHGLFTALARRDMPAPEADALEQATRERVRAAAAAGRSIAVLDYGDALVFGAQTGYLAEFADLHPVVIPGVSSFNAANAALARDVMTGGCSRSTILAAAADMPHDDAGADRIARLARTGSTLVFFTMRADLPTLVARLAPHLDGATPVAIVTHAGADARQTVLRATLATVLALAGAVKLPFEHLVYVGDFLA